MTIETKYNIGDLVGYISLNPALSYVTNAAIRYIEIMISYTGDYTVTYIMDNDEWVTESRILPK